MIVCVVPGSKVPEKVAFGAPPLPSTVVPSRNCTVPVGATPATPVTVAENVTGAPAVGGFGVIVRDVVELPCGTVDVVVCGV